MSELETDAAVVVTDASVVGNAPVAVPFALTDGAEATTALSVVGKSGGGLVAGAGGVETLGGLCLLIFGQGRRAWNYFFPSRLADLSPAAAGSAPWR